MLQTLMVDQGHSMKTSDCELVAVLGNWGHWMPMSFWVEADSPANTS